MSHFLDRLTHFSLPKETFAGDHGLTTGEDSHSNTYGAMGAFGAGLGSKERCTSHLDPPGLEAYSVVPSDCFA